jgi:hypothetical protein
MNTRTGDSDISGSQPARQRDAVGHRYWAPRRGAHEHPVQVTLIYQMPPYQMSRL